MIKVGIIGAGRIGRVHITSITTRVPDAVIKTVADPFLNDETAAWAKSMGVEHTTKDYKVLLQILILRFLLRLSRLASMFSVRNRSIMILPRSKRLSMLLRARI